MSTEKKIIVVSCPPGHPSGQRNRAGFKFFVKPVAVLATEEQVEQIKNDPVLKIHERLSRAWFETLGLAFSEDNIKKYEEQDPEFALEKLPGFAEGDTAVSDDGDKKDSPESKDDEGGDSTDDDEEEDEEKEEDEKKDKSTRLKATVSRDEAVKKLKEKGQIEGKDFDAEASRNDLVQLYNSL